MWDDFWEKLEQLGIPVSEYANHPLNNQIRKSLHDAKVKAQQHVAGGIDDDTEKERETPYSSNVVSIFYDPQADWLYLRFNSKRKNNNVDRDYLYRDLMANGFDAYEIFYSIADASSPGSAVWDELRRTNVPFQRVQ